MKKICPIVYFVLLAFGGFQSAMAQQKFTVSGYVRDGNSGEALPSATVQSPENKSGIMSNAYGFYSLTLPSDTVWLRVSYMGYQTTYQRFVLASDTTVDYPLYPQGVKLADVVIESERLDEKLHQTQMSVIKLNVETIKKIPAFMGEVDVMRAIQLMPGVQSGSEGNTGLYVRGGGQDQNLILLDDAPVYNPAHLLGFFSIFNSDAISGAELYKAGFPARYAGRLSSVVDIRMREGNLKKYRVTGGLGLIASRLTIEGPIAKDKISFIVSGRRTYVDVFTRPINKLNENRESYSPIPNYFFHDLNAKLNWKIGKRDRFFLSGYHGRDKMEFSSGKYSLKFWWGNTTGSFRWTHVFGERWFMNSTLVYSNFNLNIENEYNSYKANVYSFVNDVNARVEWDWFASSRQIIKIGVQNVYHRFIPRGVSGEIKGSEFEFDAVIKYNSHESGAYISDEVSLSEKSKLNIGLRLSSLYAQGKMYVNPEPRVSFLFKAGSKASLKLSYAHMTQYIHLLSNSAISLPTDVWYPTTANVGPQKSKQLAFGLTTFPSRGFELSTEIFGKLFSNLAEFREGSRVFGSGDFGQDLTFGRGWSYGWEIFAQKSLGAFTGWVGYTLSWSYRQFDSLNLGIPFPNRYDRRNDISVVGNWDVSPKMNIGLTWVFGTGNATTLAVGRYYFADVPEQKDAIIPDYLARNSFRMPSYHRMDLNFSYKPKAEKGHSTWILSFFNLYNRRNTFFIYYETIENHKGVPIKFRARAASLFPLLPAFTWNFTF